MIENMLIDEYQKLISTLNECQTAYDLGHPLISDKEWDDMYFRLIEIESELHTAAPNSPTQKIIYNVKSELQKVEHNHLLLSLPKTKDLNEIISFITEHDWICMAKMDGLTCSLTYRGGRLVRAETRGNGVIGEDITHNAYVIPSIPKFIPIKEEVVIDGEIVSTYENFEKFNKEYSNPRNFAAGSIRLLDSQECERRGLTFVAWDWIKGKNYFKSDFDLKNNLLSDKLRGLAELGFIVVPWQIPMFEFGETFESTIEDIKNLTNHYGYPIDGLVFKYNNCEEYEAAGRTEHHFRGGLAYKFYDELYETELLDIEWSMGRTGQISPIALFKSLNIDGANISRASLSNLSVMKATLGEKPFVGQKIQISRRNQIIPKVERAKGEDGKWI